MSSTALILECLLDISDQIIDVFDGKVTKIGFPNMVRSVSMAPGEQHFKVASVKKPFSYYVPFQRFGSQEVICNLEGKSLHTLSERALQETEPQTPADPTQPKGGFKGKGKKGGPGHYGPFDVDVVPAQMTKVQWECDTGIR